MLSDLRFALRQLAKSPGFTAIAVLTLALGIGANTAFFSVLNNTLLRPLPYPNQERLVQIDESTPTFERMSVSYPNFLDWHKQQDVFSALALYRPDTARLKTSEKTEQVNRCYFTHEFFDIFGIKLTLGRAPTADDDREGAALVGWLTDATWRKMFNSAPDIVGRSVLLDGRDVTIVGVLSPSFRFFRNIDILVPIAPYAQQSFLTVRENHSNTGAVALLKPGVQLDAAQAQLSTIAERLQREYPTVNSGLTVRVQKLQERIAGGARTNLLLLCGAVGIVLLMACVNLANMLLARSFARSREMAIRSALGASRGHLIQQLFTENMMLSLFGGAAGMLLALWGYRLIENLVPRNVRPLLETGAQLDLRVMGFALAVTLFTGLLFGLVPAWQLSQSSPIDALKQTPRTVQTLFGRMHLRDLLVGVQVALALMLLVGTSLMIRSLQRLLEVDPGLEPTHVLSLKIAPPAISTLPKDSDEFWRQIIETVQVLPGVECAALGSNIPFTGSDSYMVIYFDGRPLPDKGRLPSVSNHSVTSDYFKTLGIPLIRGRVFDGHEPIPSYPPGVPITPENIRLVFKDVVLQAVVSKSMAEKFWPGEDPIGKRFHLGYPNMNLPAAEVIGIVGDITQQGLDKGPTPEYYVMQRQYMVGFTWPVLILRTKNDPIGVANAVQAALQKAFPDHPVTDIRTLNDRIEGQVSGRKFYLRLFAFFAGTALLLALIGLYGVLAFVVGQRTREIGIRMALGARRLDVLLDILRHGLFLVIPGLGVGGAAAWLTSRYLQSQLYSVTTSDPTSYLLAAGLLLLAALVACLLPARRATRVNPIEALRSE